jgi:hypothetical protein
MSGVHLVALLEGVVGLGVKGTDRARTRGPEHAMRYENR